jgi:hypothetical protein
VATPLFSAFVADRGPEMNACAQRPLDHLHEEPLSTGALVRQVRYGRPR